MNWIKRFRQPLECVYQKLLIDKQLKLILLVFLPCFLISILALSSTSISAYLLAFILLVLLLVCGYAIIASKQHAQYQIRTLSSLIESMIEGDYTLRGRLTTDHAFRELLDSINQLANTLAKHKNQAQESRLLLNRIMAQMDAVIIAINADGRVVMANGSANKLILGNVTDVTQLKLASCPAGGDIIAAETGLIAFDYGVLSGEYFLFRESFLSEGDPHQLFMLTKAERVLMEKEREAWQRLLRVLSHEMNNSLTPIITVSQSMQKRLAKDEQTAHSEALLDGVKMINERADSLSEFIASYSRLYHLPQPVKARFNLSDLVDNLRLLYPKVTIENPSTTDHQTHADKNQLEQVLINLFKNAAEAMLNCQHPVIQVSSHWVGDWQHITIRDQGTGIINLDNVFVPFYTTKPSGSGIGLTLCQHILFNHKGTIKIDNHSSGQGVEVVLSLPRG